MDYTQIVTNDEGEVLGTEYIYEEEPFLIDPYEDYDDGPWDGDDDYEDDTFRSEQESDLAGEWDS